MTAVPARAPHLPTGPHRLTFMHQLHSELIKLLTVRGTWWSVAIVAALNIGLALLVTMTLSAPADVMMAVVAPIQFTMLLGGILGVISVTAEYATGMIRSTLTATPTRGSVLVAKAVVLAVFMFVVSSVILFAAAVVITPLAAASDMTVPWADAAQSIVPIVSAAGAMALFALLGLGVGFLLRSGSGAIAVTVGVLFVLPIIVSLLAGLAPDARWLLNLGDHLPAAAAQSAIMPADDWGLGVGEAWATLIAWPGIILLGAWAVLRRRDA